jgi:hygromycin-B 4-O-kinase
VLDWGCAKYGDYLYELAWFTFWGDYHECLKDIDFKSIAHRSFVKNSLDVENFEKRLRCYEIHIGLDSLAYTAWAVNHEDMKETANRLRKRLK